MKTIIQLLGIALIIFGIGVLGYKGFTYTKQEKVAELGDVQVTVANEEHVYLSPAMGIASLIVGGALIVIGRRT